MKNYCVLLEYHKCVLLPLTKIVNPTNQNKQPDPLKIFKQNNFILTQQFASKALQKIKTQSS